MRSGSRLRLPLGASALLALALALTSAAGAGQVGGGEAGASTAATAPAGTLSSRAVSAGDFSCGLRTDATLACWGDNRFGQATPPAGIFTAVSAGGFHSCGLRTNGTLACWGSNDFGEATPTAGSFTAVSAGQQYGCGLRTDETLACWGNPWDGRTTPPSGSFTALSAGDQHGCGLRTDGTIACWGDNRFGQAMPPAGSFTAVSAGREHSCGLRTDGTLTCWGLNPDGRATPPAGSFTAVSAGSWHSCGVRTEGIACWGSNADGQLGAAPARPSPAPAPAFAGLAYSHTFASSSGSPAGAFTVTAGNLPHGLNLSPGGVLSGRPTGGGSFAFMVTASNGLFADASASFELTVIDRSPPVITASVGGTVGQNGWYRSDVTLTWTVAEPESGSTLSTSGCEPTTIANDTAGATRTCAATSAGGTASQSVTIRRDTTAPTVTIQAPTPTTYPHAQTVPASYGCTDAGSGMGACTGPVAAGAPIVTAGAGAKSFTVTASDRAGNTSSRTVEYSVTLDQTAPLISIAGVRGRGRLCTARDFRVLVAIREASQLRYARLLLNRRRRLDTRKTRFAVPIRASQLRSGRHLITVTAEDSAGNRRTRSVRFTRCAGPSRHAQR